MEFLHYATDFLSCVTACDKYFTAQYGWSYISKASHSAWPLTHMTIVSC